MSIDETKIAYSSAWDIDQLLTTNTITVGSGNTALYAITNSPSLPLWEVQFKPTGSNSFYESGTSSMDGTFAGEFTFYSYVTGNSIFITTTTGGTARYFVWSDKVDY